MNILIIEDEINAAKDLEQMLIQQNRGYIIKGITDSIEESIEWLQDFGQPDLIFSDIQLADGLSFEIFKQFPITCPIIFTTAYDEYAIQAFESNGIGYLLKPTDEKKLVQALDKIDLLRGNFLTQRQQDGQSVSLDALLSSLQKNYKSYKTSLLVSFKGKIFPLPANEIACFTIQHAVTFVHNMAGKSYVIPQTMEELEESFDPSEFYRANRQALISFAAIREVEHYFGRKLLIHLKISLGEKIIVSKPKSSHFLTWMQNR